MGEMMIRRAGSFPVARYQEVSKPEKTPEGSESQSVKKSTGLNVSETLRQIISGQTEQQIRESRRTLRLGEGALAEVKDKLDRIAELVRESAGGKEPDRGALQAELEQLRSEIDRVLDSAMSGGTKLFLDGGAEDGLEALLRAVMGKAADGGAQSLPSWLAKGIAQSGLRAEQMLMALGVDKSVSGAELLAAVANGSLDGDSVLNSLAALYLGAVIAGSDLSKPIDTDEAMAGLQQLLEKVSGGMSPDEAIALLTDGAFTSFEDFESQFLGGMAPDLESFLVNLLLSDSAAQLMNGSPLLNALAGMEGLNLELLMGLLTAGQGTAKAGQEADMENASQTAAETASPSSDISNTGMGAAAALGTTASAERPNTSPVFTMQFGNIQVTGQDLSGISCQETANELTISGGADVTVHGTGQGEQAIQITGSGTVTLHNVHASALTVDSAAARIFSAGENVLGTVLLREGTSLTFGGSGLLHAGAFHTAGSNTLRLTGGAVILPEEKNNGMVALNIPVIMENTASFAARAVNVSSPDGKTMEPFDIIWKTLLPGWDAVTAMAVDGRQAKMQLFQGDTSALARLWMDKGDPSHGYPIHTVVIQGRDQEGQPKTRYAYLRWNEKTGAFEEVAMYPNPFRVTGGEENLDWLYEEESHTLRILTSQVTAVSGGSGMDANQLPFSGRLSLEDGIGAIQLTLCGVACQVSAGRAFQLGEKNQVTLILQRGADNYFESGAGWAGISLGAGSSLRIDRAAYREGDSRIPMGTLMAAGGAGGAGIGRDSGGSNDRSSYIQIAGGVITAVGTGGGAGIGGALGTPIGDIGIHGGTITATASSHAAAIGAGVRGNCGDILIAGNARIIKAQGGDPGADIGACLFGECGRVLVSGGANIGKASLSTQAGISLQMGEDSVTLPQFRLSSRSLQLDRLCVSTRENAQSGRGLIAADLRWVAQVQKAYNKLYRQLEQSACAEGPVRDTASANILLEEMRRAILLQSGQTVQTHSKRVMRDVQQLLK